MKYALFVELRAQGDVRAGAAGTVYDEYRPERIPEYDDLVRKQAAADAKAGR